MNLTPPKPPPGGAPYGFLAAAALRAFFLAVLVFIVDYAVDLGTSPWWVCLGAAAGTACASMLAPTRLKFAGFAAGLALLYLAAQGVFAWMQWTAAAAPVFGVFNLSQHAELVLAAFLLAALSTWWFWRLEHALTLEVVCLGAFFVYLLSGHRNYRFDLVKLINTLAWSFGISQLAMLVITGAAIFLWLLTYLLCATLTVRPLRRRGAQTARLHAAPPSALGALTMAAAAAALLALISFETYQHHLTVSSALIRNGVGDKHEQGLSPLTFQSALGSSNQPAALVRLEGDYRENPFSPMLYLREAALSQFNGRELVAAGPPYDKDVSNTAPGQRFSGPTDGDLLSREPVTQSVYLLTEHNLAFGLDYPVFISGLKMPAGAARFKGAFRVYSMAPAFSTEQIKSLPVGDPRWSEEERAHYLAGSTDPRYLKLADEIAGKAAGPVEKAFAVSAYLSHNAIYTLTPGHTVQPDEDPVAPFLFGDQRGYCVHFSHAIVLMLRALGIPARIGTGYLTDMSQSKDGHILLRMSDRHAWAEVYVTGRGWVPFDVKPERVESHAETPVDMKLLEELMSMLGPSEEILPKDAAKDEPGLAEEEAWAVPRPGDFALPVGLVLTALVLIKLFRLFGWRLPAAPRTRLRRLHRAAAARLYDMGISRNFGETRLEFQDRARRALNTDLLCCTAALNFANYGGAPAGRLDGSGLQELAALSRRALAAVPLSRRALAWVNPSSVIAGLGGWRW